MLIDSHCHLDYLARDGLDLTEIVGRARRNGVSGFLTIGTRFDRFHEVRAAAERFDDVWCTVGVHPHEAETEIGVGVEDILGVTRDEKVVAVGETGLDFFYDHSPRDLQRKSFETHIEAAAQSGLPLIVHTRDADEETADILTSATRGASPVQGVLHCFSSGRELAEKALDFGFYISLSGIVTFNKAEELRAIAKDIPIERLLVETDSPYLAPVPKRGKKNEPSYVVHTAECVAELRGISLEELAHHTTENFFTLFPKAKAASDASVSAHHV